MDIMGLLFLLSLVQWSPLPALSREFHFVNLSKTWIEAQSYCREKFADLATIETLEDQTRVKELLKSSGATVVLIGLYDDVKSWRWSLDNTYLYEGGDADLENWFDFEQSNLGDGEHCGSVYQGKLLDQKCDISGKSVCYDENSNSYIPVDDPKTWSAARSYCRETHSDLASVRSQQEMNHIMAVTDNSQWWWIGLSRDGWKWSDQSNSSLNLWAPGQPEGGKQNFGCTKVAGWHDTYSHAKFPFICSAPVKVMKVMKVALEMGVSADLNNPLFKEALLKQMQKDMREQGIHQDFTLRWKKQPDGKVFHQANEP